VQRRVGHVDGARSSSRTASTQLRQHVGVAADTAVVLAHAPRVPHPAVARRPHQNHVQVKVKVEVKVITCRSSVGEAQLALNVSHWQYSVNSVYRQQHPSPPLHALPLYAALPFTRRRYCRVARRLCIDVHDDDDNA